MYKSQWKIDFLSNFYPIFPDLCHFIQLYKITPFFYNFSVSGGGGSFPPCGRPCSLALYCKTLYAHFLGRSPLISRSYDNVRTRFEHTMLDLAHANNDHHPIGRVHALIYNHLCFASGLLASITLHFSCFHSPLLHHL